jgi:Short C-terminal domain
MPMMRRRPLLRAAAIGTVAYQGSKRGAMAGQEQAAQAQAPPPPPPAAPPQPAAPASAPADPVVEKINQLAQLHASGALTDEEFAAAKARALGI